VRWQNANKQQVKKNSPRIDVYSNFEKNLLKTGYVFIGYEKDEEGDIQHWKSFLNKKKNIIEVTDESGEPFYSYKKDSF
jgi:ribosomal protein S4E